MVNGSKYGKGEERNSTVDKNSDFMCIGKSTNVIFVDATSQFSNEIF